MRSDPGGTGGEIESSDEDNYDEFLRIKRGFDFKGFLFQPIGADEGH